LGDPYETVLNKALLYISPVAFQPFSASGNAPQTKATLFQNKAVSDNIKMDRQDMWMKPNL